MVKDISFICKYALVRLFLSPNVQIAVFKHNHHVSLVAMMPETGWHNIRVELKAFRASQAPTFCILCKSPRLWTCHICLLIYEHPNIIEALFEGLWNPGRMVLLSVCHTPGLPSYSWHCWTQGWQRNSAVPATKQVYTELVSLCLHQAVFTVRVF